MEVKYLLNKITKIKSIKKIRCPTCNKDSVESYNPFCSKKCSDTDLIKWLKDENDNPSNGYGPSSQ